MYSFKEIKQYLSYSTNIHIDYINLKLVSIEGDKYHLIYDISDIDYEKGYTEESFVKQKLIYEYLLYLRKKKINKIKERICLKQVIK